MREAVILVHGFFRGHSDMKYLEAGLSDAGFQAFSARLPTFFGSFDACVDSLWLQTSEIISEYSTIHYVAHSMGGLIVRGLIDRLQQNTVGKCVLIATPHKGSELADIADAVPLYSTVFRPISSLSSKNTPLITFPQRNFRIGAVAGNYNEGLIGKILMSNRSDGRVSVESVKVDDLDDFIELPFGHHSIHHTEDALREVISYLQHGHFTR